MARSKRLLRSSQREALRACADPSGGYAFWFRAGVFGPVDGHAAAGAWQTLRSLVRLGLVTDDGGWSITPAGQRLLAELSVRRNSRGIQAD